MSRREKLVILLLFTLIVTVISFKLLGSAPPTTVENTRRAERNVENSPEPSAEVTAIHKDISLGAGPTAQELSSEFERELLGTDAVQGSSAKGEQERIGTPDTQRIEDPTLVNKAPVSVAGSDSAPSLSAPGSEREPREPAVDLELQRELAERDLDLKRAGQQAAERERLLLQDNEALRRDIDSRGAGWKRLELEAKERERGLIEEVRNLRIALRQAEERSEKREQSLLGAGDKMKAELQVLAETTAKLKAAENERLQLMVTLKRNLEDREVQKQEMAKLTKELDSLKRSAKEEGESLQSSLERAKRGATARESELQGRVDLLKKTLAAAESVAAEVSAKNDILTKQVAASNAVEERLKKSLAEVDSVRKELKELQAAKDQQLRTAKEKDAALADLTARFESLKKEHDSSLEAVEREKKGTAELRAKITELESRYAAAKSDLLFATTQLEVLQRGSGASPVQRRVPPLPAQDLQRTAPEAQRELPRRPMNDVETVAVAVDKANLRAGPGDEHSPVMEVGGGTVLTVEERRGEWLRVVSPTGGRAFIRADLTQPPGFPIRRAPKLKDDDAITQPRVAPEEIDVEKQALERLREAFPAKR